jgi:hypothetical protein
MKLCLCNTVLREKFPFLYFLPFLLVCVQSQLLCDGDATSFVSLLAVHDPKTWRSRLLNPHGLIRFKTHLSVGEKDKLNHGAECFDR